MCVAMRPLLWSGEVQHPYRGGQRSEAVLGAANDHDVPGFGVDGDHTAFVGELHLTGPRPEGGPRSRRVPGTRVSNSFPAAGGPRRLRRESAALLPPGRERADDRIRRGSVVWNSTPRSVNRAWNHRSQGPCAKNVSRARAGEYHESGASPQAFGEHLVAVGGNLSATGEVEHRLIAVEVGDLDQLLRSPPCRVNVAGARHVPDGNQ